MSAERPLPRLPISRALVIVTLFLSFAAFATWFAVRYEDKALLLILFFAPVIIGYFYYYRRRCPECRGRLTFRRDYIGSTQQYRVLLDCPRCQIAWDTGHIGDESSSGD